jgi:SAM-dependent methyltransferase
VQAPPGADRGQLRTAYADGTKLRDRVALYRYQTPQIRFPDWALSHLELHDGDRVVDVGCGPGIYERRLAAGPVPVRTVALDQSPGMVAEAGGGIVGDAQALPLRPAVADIVLAMHFLYHVLDIPAAVAELARIVRPGGVVMVSANGHDHHYRVPELLAAASGTPVLGRPGQRFDLGNAPAHLAARFEDIETDAVTARIVLTEPDPIVRFIDSCEEFYAPLLPEPDAWPAVVDRVREIVADEIAARGSFEMGTESGVFLCRRPVTPG